MTTDLHTRLARISHILSNGGTVATERVIEALDEAAALAAAPSADTTADTTAKLAEALEEAANETRHPDYDWPLWLSRKVTEVLATYRQRTEAAPSTSPAVAAETETSEERWSRAERQAIEADAAARAHAAAAVAGEPLYLVHAGGDGYQAEIVPESKLDDAYLLTQWGSLDDIDPEQRAAALEHFHDDDEWSHEDVTGNGPRLKFGLSFEDGWVEVIRLPLNAPHPSPSAAAAEDGPGLDIDPKSTVGELAKHVGAWETSEGFVCFGSWMAVAAMHHHILKGAAEQWKQMYPSAAEQEAGSFKNFHRALCERFGYSHDPVDWRRDQVSLIEHIATKVAAAEQAGRWVPLVPTTEMVANAMRECGGIGAGSCGEHSGVDCDDMRSVWDAMLAAAPSASPAEAPAEDAAAIKTLTGLGYTWAGGELWKPPLGHSPFVAERDGHFCIVRLDGRAMMEGSHACSVRWGFDSTRVREYPTLANARNSIEVCCDDDDGAAFPMLVGAWKALAERGNEWREPPAEQAWHAPARKLAEWLLCMSYNDSYFGEPAGLVKQATAELNRLLPTAPSPAQPVAPAGQAAAGVQGEELKRLADKALDARGALCVVPSLQRTDAQIARCDEARAALLAAIDAFAAPAVERGVAEELPPAFDYAASKQMAVTKEWCRGWDDARAALSTPATQETPDEHR